MWASAGFAHLHVDTRGRGSAGSVGVAPDSAGTGPQHPGVLTRGIESPETYYYRRLYTDAVRAVDAVRDLAAMSELTAEHGPPAARSRRSPARCGSAGQLLGARP